VITGYHRATGLWGSRNHLLVLPSVVCAGLVARRIAGTNAIVIDHQHGCDHVGDDATQTQRILVGIATNPNVSGVVLVSLGCETIQGRVLSEQIQELGQRVKFVEIQGCGGTANSTEIGQDQIEELQSIAATEVREVAPPSALKLGIAVPAMESNEELLDQLAMRILEAGDVGIVAVTQGGSFVAGPWGDAERISYGSPSRATLSIMEHSGTGAQQHSGLAAAGCQVIVSLRPKGSAPIGSPTCPVVSVSLHSQTYQALADDFDLDASSLPADGAAHAIWEQVNEAFNGTPTASERRGAGDFALHRIARST
jgi:altronate dehydratase large subunit